MTLAATITTSALTENRWYQLLYVFVTFNTLVYAALALAKMWPRRRRR